MKRNELTHRLMDDDTRSRAEIAAALATYMYVITRVNAPDGATVAQIIDSVDSGEDRVKRAAAYLAFRAAALKHRREMMGLRLCLQSRLMNGVLSGARAAVFAQGEHVYVAYRGTDDLEWTDNGMGMFERSTRLQRLAVMYFDVAVQRLGLDESCLITVCGHSKGGNKAQFVMLDSDSAGLIDSCWSFDGQGFSPEAIEYYKDKLGKEYRRRRARMFSVCGENDYVNPLGNRIIPASKTYYLETPRATLESFLSNHIVENLWVKGEEGFTGSLNTESGCGDLCRFSGRLSRSIMALPVDERQNVAMTVTRIIENMDGERVSGNDRSSGDAVRALISAIPGALMSLFLSVEGRRLAVGYADIFTKSKKRDDSDEGFWRRAAKRLKNAALHVLLTLASIILAVPTAAVWIYSALRRKFSRKRNRDI